MIDFLCLNSNVKPDCILIAETWLGILDVSFVSLPGYRIVSHFERLHRKGGGLIVFVKESLMAENCTIISSDDDLEIVHCRVHGNLNRVINLYCLYRPPQGNVQKFFEKFSSVANEMNVNNYNFLIGDYNIDFLKKDGNYNNFSDIMHSFGLRQYVKEATRITDESRSLIDLVISNYYINEENILNLANDLSDHNAIIVNLCFEPLSYVNEEKFRVVDRDIDIDEFRSSLISHCQNDFEHLFPLDSPVKVNDFVFKCFLPFCSGFTRLVQHQPKNHRERKRKPWLNEQLLKLINTKHKYLSILNKQKFNGSLKERLGKLNVEIRKMRIALKKSYYDKLLDSASGNSEKTWSILNEILGRQCRIVNASKCLSGHYGTYCPSDIADRFAFDYCESIKLKYAPVGGQFSVDNLVERTNEQIDDCILVEAVKRSFGSCVKKNNFDRIGLSSKLLAYSEFFLGEHMVDMVRNMIDLCFIPDFLLRISLTPIPKCINPAVPSDFRLIACIPWLTKFLDKSLSLVLEEHCYRNNIIDRRQFAYQRGTGTDGALVNVFCDIVKHIDKNGFAIAVFFDLTKAFDLVDRGRLYQILYEANVPLGMIRCIKYLLENTKYCLRIDESYSEEFCLPCGVTQGSSLGPVLFIIYVNTIFRYMRDDDLTVYADDITYISSDKSMDVAISHINSKLKNFGDWARDMGCCINYDKTKCLIFSYGVACEFSGSIVLDDNIISRVDSIKYLGVIFDERLIFDRHVNELAHRLGHINGVLFRVRNILNYRSRLTIYRSLFESRLIYACFMWGSTHKYIRMRILRLQKKAIRNIFAVNYLFHTHDLFVISKCMRVDLWYFYSVLMVFLNRLKDLRKYCFDVETNRSNRPTRIYRNPAVLLPRFKVNSLHRTFLSQGCRFFNTFCRNFDLSIDISDLKFVLKDILWKNFIDSSDWIDCEIIDMYTNN